jgi:hypothetical protein
MSALLPVLSVIQQRKAQEMYEGYSYKLAIVVQKSGNAKIGDVSTTYQPTTHCVDCPLKEAKACYAMHGSAGIHTRRVNRAAAESHASPLRTAKQEATGIDALKAQGQGLRIHTSGDCPTNETASVVSNAAERFMARGGGKAWTYTHAWRRVRRASWGGVSVLASVESTKDAKRAARRGYAVARVVAKFDGPKAWTEDGMRWIPCPAQTRDDVTCDSCRLCWDDSKLRGIGAGIAFEAHGSAHKRAASCAE